MAVQLQFTPNYAFADGAFAPGAKVSFFLSGTSTPATVYSDEALTTPHPSPLVADATGRFAAVFGANGTDYKAVVTASDDSAIATLDPVVLGNISVGQAADLSLAPVAGLTATNVQDGIAELAPKASPALTGTPTAPTAAAGTDTTQIATTAFVRGEFERGSAAIATTSGTSISQAIPAGVQEVTVIFNGVSMIGTAPIAVFLRTGGAAVTSGYIASYHSFTGSSTVANDTTTSYFLTGSVGATDAVHGVMRIVRSAAGENKWFATMTGRTSNTNSFISSGYKELAGELDGIGFSGGTFDAGEIYVRWQ